MGLLDAGIYGVHLVFAALWAGSVVFVTVAVLPTATSGVANAGPLASVTRRLTQVSRASALLLLVTGGHLAATRYPGTALLDTTRGNLVLAMVVLWFALGALVELGTSKLTSGFAAQKVRTPATEARPFFRASSLVAILLLLDAGAILGL